MSKKPYLVITIFFAVVVVISAAIWLSPFRFGGDLLTYIALLASAFAAIALYNYWDIGYLETRGEDELREYMADCGYSEIKNPNVCPHFYVDKLSKTEEAEFHITIPLNKIVKIRTPLANIVHINRRYTSLRFRCYDLVYDYFNDEYLLFSED